MRGRRILIFIVLVVFAMVAVILLNSSMGSTTYPIMISILLAAVLVLISVGVTTDFYSDLVDSLRTDSLLKIGACRFYLYGRGGSGKTTLIKNWLGGDTRPEQSTKYFAFYSGEKYLDLETKKQTRVILSDYQGQSPSQNTLNASPKVIGQPGRRLVNAVFFIVDIAPRLERNNQPLSNEELIDWLATDTESKIQKRLEQHMEYIVPAILEIVFATIYSTNLLNVTLVINKIDLLETVVSMGCIPGVSQANVDEYARNLFRRIEMNMREACDRITSPEHHIDFNVSIVSAAHGTCVAQTFNEVLRRYANVGSSGRTKPERRRAST
ncbi:MAG: ATP-binding protein [Cyanobacteria bacterium P01_G01_bin.54]